MGPMLNLYMIVVIIMIMIVIILIILMVMIIPETLHCTYKTCLYRYLDVFCILRQILKLYLDLSQISSRWFAYSRVISQLKRAPSLA